MNGVSLLAETGLPSISESILPLMGSALTECVSVAKDLLPMIVGCTLLFAAFKMVPKFVNKFASRIG